MGATIFIQIFDLGGQFAWAVVSEPDASANPLFRTLEDAVSAAFAANPGLEVRQPDGTVLQQDPAGESLTQ